MSTTPDLNVAARLKLARMEAGFATATDAAKAFGWTPSTYLGHENGSRGLQVDAAQRYARAFKVSLTWLLTAREEQTTEPFGVYVVAQLGYNAERPDLHSNEKIIPVGVEGYDTSELFAVADPRSGMNGGPEYIICAKWSGDYFVTFDELIVLRPEGSGYLLTTARALLPEGHRTQTFLMPGRGGSSWPNPDKPARESLAEDGVEVVGVAVGYYTDRHRRSFVEGLHNA